jgi:type II secretory pathway pseudopilin PulG
MHRRWNGYSLIEVLVATALLAGVLVSMASLMVIGGRQANRGRSATEALSVAGAILEEVSGWGFDQTYSQFGLDGTASSYTVSTRTNGYAAKWQPNLEEKLASAEALIRIESLTPSGTPPALDATRAIRVTVDVRWQEGQKLRNIHVSTVRM